ncbi:hypothetical protein [Halorussus amylolyticus]|uniref:hypothetical protein n=1 Tax=Halorussus amylolyticus TaxID=1126242 RepID=UPI00138F27E9|nr:hypothetical protein [Halorussus amylolyticus]
MSDLNPVLKLFAPLAIVFFMVLSDELLLGIVALILLQILYELTDIRKQLEADLEESK